MPVAKMNTLPLFSGVDTFAIECHKRVDFTVKNPSPAVPETTILNILKVAPKQSNLKSKQDSFQISKRFGKINMSSILH